MKTVTKSFVLEDPTVYKVSEITFGEPEQDVLNNIKKYEFSDDDQDEYPDYDIEQLHTAYVRSYLFFYTGVKFKFERVTWAEEEYRNELIDKHENETDYQPFSADLGDVAHENQNSADIKEKYVVSVPKEFYCVLQFDLEFELLDQIEQDKKHKLVEYII